MQGIEGIRHGEPATFSVGCRCESCIEAKLNDYAVVHKLKWVPPHYSDVCEVCGTSDTVIDHDHETMEFRGWLCYRCSTGLGYFGDSLTGLRQVLEYLEYVRTRNREWVSSGHVTDTVYPADTRRSAGHNRSDTVGHEKRTRPTEADAQRAIQIFIESVQTGRALSKKQLADATGFSLSWAYTQMLRARKLMGETSRFDPVVGT